MGRAQFSTSIAEFSQAQIDAIQAAVAAVQTSVDAIQSTDIASVKNDTAAILGKVDTEIATVVSDVATIKGKVDTEVASILADTATLKGNTDTLETAVASIKVFPTKMRSADFELPLATVNTYYTILDVAGSGILVSFLLGGEMPNGSTYDYKITLDGVLYSFDSLAGKARNMGGMYNFLYDANVKFNTSLKIEFKYTTSESKNMSCAVNYGLY